MADIPAFVLGNDRKAGNIFDVFGQRMFGRNVMGCQKQGMELPSGNAFYMTGGSLRSKGI